MRSEPELVEAAEADRPPLVEVVLAWEPSMARGAVSRRRHCPSRTASCRRRIPHEAPAPPAMSVQSRRGSHLRRIRIAVVRIFGTSGRAVRFADVFSPKQYSAPLRIAAGVGVAGSDRCPSAWPSRLVRVCCGCSRVCRRPAHLPVVTPAEQRTIRAKYRTCGLHQQQRLSNPSRSPPAPASGAGSSVASPSCPPPLSPQQNSAPSARIAQPWKPPALTRSQSEPAADLSRRRSGGGVADTELPVRVRTPNRTAIHRGSRT